MGKDYLGEAACALEEYRIAIRENPELIDDTDLEVLADIEEQAEYLKYSLNKK